MTTLTPKVLWAERKQYIFITIELQDVQNAKLDVTKDSFSFEGEVKGEKYAISFELNGEVVVEESTNSVTPRQVELKLKKAEEGYWNKLQKGPKTERIAIDWSKYAEEDEDQAADFGGFGGDAGFGGMGGMGGMPGMGGPGGMDFASMLGGMGGAGGMGGMDLQAMMAGLGGAGGADGDFGDDEGDDEGEDDEGPPPLEGDAAEATEAAE